MTNGSSHRLALPAGYKLHWYEIVSIARKGPTFRECVLMHAVARLVFHHHLPNIQVSWVKMGPAGLQRCLGAGANDVGGSLMNETITRSAGAAHGQEMPPERLETLISGKRCRIRNV